MANSGDTVCNCKNTCNILPSNKQGKPIRGQVCPCKARGLYCCPNCQCGSEYYPCSNRPPQNPDAGIESEDDLWGETSVTSSASVNCRLYFEDVGPLDVEVPDELNTSLQEHAHDNINSSIEEEPATAHVLPVEIEAKQNKSAQGQIPANSHKPTNKQAQKARPSKEKKNKEAAQVRQQSKPTPSSARLSNNKATKQINECSGTVLRQVKNLSSEASTSLLLNLTVLYPELVALAMNPPPEPTPLHELPSWCHCGRCRRMGKDIEHVCCRKRNGPCTTVTNIGQLNQLVLCRGMLEQVVLNHNAYCCQHDDPADHRALRHMAYRKYVVMKNGRLGRGKRVVIPSCVVWLVRDKYPNQPGEEYRGFISPLVLKK